VAACGGLAEHLLGDDATAAVAVVYLHHWGLDDLLLHGVLLVVGVGLGDHGMDHLVHFGVSAGLATANAAINTQIHPSRSTPMLIKAISYPTIQPHTTIVRKSLPECLDPMVHHLILPLAIDLRKHPIFIEIHSHLPHIKIDHLRVNPLKDQLLKLFKFLADHGLLLAAPAHLAGEIVAGADRDDADRHVMDRDAVLDDLFDDPEDGAVASADYGAAVVAHRLGFF
jgi:hypothetical protein